MLINTDKEIYRKKIDTLNCCILIPTYNNEQTLFAVINDVLSFTNNVIVVNDGSTDSTSEVLKKFPNISIISYKSNKGKGLALRKGMKYAVDKGYHYAITIDSDGQHFANDLPNFLEKLESTGPCLIIGARNMNQSSVPGKSSFGNRFSSFWFRVETGISAPDTQSGYRLYPLCLIKEIKFLTRKYEFEIEVIVRASWKNIKIESVPISVFYAPKETRISHFRPFKDFTRISVLNTILVIFAFTYIKPRNFFRNLFKNYTTIKIKEQIFGSQDSKIKISTSVAFGIFMGIVPIWGFQLILAILLSILFRLNKAIVIICANISIPPMIPLIIFLSYKMGSIWQGKEAIQLHFDRSITLETIRLNYIQYIYGSLSLAIIASMMMGISTYLFLTIFKKEKELASNE